MHDWYTSIRCDTWIDQQKLQLLYGQESDTDEYDKPNCDEYHVVIKPVTMELQGWKKKTIMNVQCTREQLHAKSEARKKNRDEDEENEQTT